MLRQPPFVMLTARAGNRVLTQHRCVRAALVVASFLYAGCTTTQDTQQHREKLRSLASTSETISGAWLDGRVSRTYARTSFRQTYALVEQERAAIAESPQTLTNPDGQSLSAASERLARTVAVLIEGVSASDADAVRLAAKDIPSIPAEPH
jgi:hypothetical protein